MRTLNLSDDDIIAIGNSKGYFIASELIVYSPLFGQYEINIITPLSALLAFSVEFALKAYLIHSGVERRDLKKRDVRHNLACLLSMARDHGFVPDKNLEEIIKKWQMAHSSHAFRYMPPDAEYFKFDSWVEVLKVISGLIVDVEANIGAKIRLLGPESVGTPRQSDST